MALIEMKNQFSGLDMGELIGGPLKAACNAQVMLAQSTATFIEQVGFQEVDGQSVTRTADFSFEKNEIAGKDDLGHDIIEKSTVKMSVPMLAIVNVPSLMVDDVDITFDMEVKSSESSKESSSAEASLTGGASVGWGPFSVNVSVSGSVSTHQENVRTSDNSAKYHVRVHASQAGTPEGLSRVLDIIAAAVAPEAVEGPQKRRDKQIENQLKPLVSEKNRIEREIDDKKFELEQLTANATQKEEEKGQALQYDEAKKNQDELVKDDTKTKKDLQI